MSPVRRAAIVLSAVLLAWPTACVLAQRGPIIIPPSAPAKPIDAAGDDAFTLPSDPRLAAKLEAAADYIHDEDWGTAVRVLQQLLDVDGDPTAVIGGDKNRRTVSARAEAQRLLASLPPAGRKAYQEAQGPRAAEMAQAAIKDKDDEKLAEVVRRFAFTDAGSEALEALAGMQYDAGRYHLAALAYLRLLEGRDLAKWSPEGLFRAADAFHRIGDKAHADAATKQLLDRIGDKELLIGERKLGRDDVRKELTRPVEASADWPLYGGDAGRSAQGDGGMPFLWRRWMEPTTNSFLNYPVYPVTGASSGAETEFATKLAALFRKAADAVPPVNQPVLPPQFPVAAGVTFGKDGKKRSVVVCRTHAGITEMDMANGKVVGYSPTDGSLEWMMDDSRKSALATFEQAYIGQNGLPSQRPGIFFENTTIGTLSIDGDFAYTVADLAVPKPLSYRAKDLQPGSRGNPFGWPKEVMDAISHNRLAAYDLSRGCTTVWHSWYFDQDNKDAIPELSGCYFLGPPLPLDGRLFVLAEKQQELRLIGLENVKDDAGAWKPKVDFVLPLGAAHDSSLDDDALRRITAVHLAYADGLLVCPTNLGYVIGVDPLQRCMLWVHNYRDKAGASLNGLPPGVIRVLPGGIMIGANGQQIQPTLPQQGWRGGAPIVQDGKVVFTAYDSKSIHCVNLRDGSPVWSRPRQENDLYVGGVVNGKVIVVGQKVVRAYNLANGEKPWEAVETGLPTGFGAASDSVYYLPVKGFAGGKEAEVCAIDVARGQVLAHSRVHTPPGSEGEKAPGLGNLIFAGGAVISQTNENVTAYPLMKAKLEEMNAALVKNPDDAEGLLSRAELRLEAGKVADAVEDLHKVIDGKPPENLLRQANHLLYPALTQILQRDFVSAEKYLKEYDELCHVSGDAAETLRRRAVMFLLVGRGFEGEGKWKEPLDAYADLAELGDEPLLASPDDPARRAAPSVLGKAAINELLKKAPAEKRKELEEEIRRVLDKAKESKGDGDLRSCIAAFGPDTDGGREARLVLAERLMTRDGRELEAEVLLTTVARKDDAGQAARAVEALARLSTKLGLLDDALYYYRVLDRDYGAVKVRDGKTGAEIYKEIQTDKRFLPLLDNPKPDRP